MLRNLWSRSPGNPANTATKQTVTGSRLCRLTYCLWPMNPLAAAIDEFDAGRDPRR
ncbi:hypothetical protein I552_7845 [Mycobacterium xenopi 3993]|nr:hypothetical protein I552_7845 [Mycobacterium xenopi 3993]